MEDLISREAAIDALRKLSREDGYIDLPHEYVTDAVRALPSAQPEPLVKESRTLVKDLVKDTISRQAAIDAAIDAVDEWDGGCNPSRADMIEKAINKLLSAQPEIIRCKDCIYYDPPHVENNGARYEYDEMPADAFDALGTGLVNAEYGINIGGRCCVDYYCKNYSDDKRVFVREDNYCGRAERRTDD